MSKEAIKNLLMDFMADYDPNKWSNDDVYEKYAEKIDNVRSMGEIIAFTELSKKVKDLEHRLANCIEPKFKAKQTIWFIRGSSNKRIDKGIVYGFVNNKCIRLKQHGSHLTRDLSSVFATKEEAKAKLEEIQNANN